MPSRQILSHVETIDSAWTHKVNLIESHLIQCVAHILLRNSRQPNKFISY